MKTRFFLAPSEPKDDYISFYPDGTIKEFMKHNPPCKQCLIQAICIRYNNHLEIKACDKLKNFIMNNKYFY